MNHTVNFCDCSSNGLYFYQPCRNYACGGCNTTGCDNITSNINLKITEKRIQNQVRVQESQYIDVLGATTIAKNYLNKPANPEIASSIWSNRFSLRNQSDRHAPSRTNTSIQTNLVNIPTRGNSTRSTITANKPGAMAPGGYGVDVKHGSYARYLGKLKGRTMAVPHLNGNDIKYSVPKNAVVNNKSFRFNLLNINCKCNGLDGSLGQNIGIYK